MIKRTDATWEQLRAAWDAWQRGDPCSLCGNPSKPGSPTCDGRNLCAACWEKEGRPCSQIYPGDKGYPPVLGTLDLGGLRS